MAAVYHLVELQYLGDEWLRVLQPSRLCLRSDAGLKGAIVSRSKAAPWEEIIHDAFKEWDIERDKLWQVHIADAS